MSNLIPVVEKTANDIADRLIALGWLEPEERNSVFSKGKAFIEAIRAFQDFYNLKVDEIIGPKTLKALFPARRCGLCDVAKARKNICKWDITDVSINVGLVLQQLNRIQILDAMQEVCNRWNAVCGINLHLTENRSSAHILSDSGQGQADYLDGPNGTLAWSYLPCGGQRQLQQKYDVDEDWNFNFLATVATHEVGHAIGLDHLRVGNLMQPIYDPNIDRPQAGDIEQVVLRYGPPAKKPQPTPPPVIPDVPSTPTTLVGRRLIVRIEDII